LTAASDPGGAATRHPSSAADSIGESTGDIAADNSADIPADIAADSSADLERRFGGLRRLWGDVAYARVRAARVAVVGVGGVGSWAVEALARCGVAELVLIDFDQVAESNINRQVQALGQTVGCAKVDALARRIADIHPGCRVHRVEQFVEPARPARADERADAPADARAGAGADAVTEAVTDVGTDALAEVLTEALAETGTEAVTESVTDSVTNAQPGNWPALLPGPVDVVIDACDQGAAKFTLATWSLAGHGYLVIAGAAGGKTRPQDIEVADLAEASHDPLLATLRQRVRRWLRDQPAASLVIARPTAQHKAGTQQATQRLGLRCVFSREAMVRPGGESACAVREVPAGLNCAGYGSSMMVTAAMGLAAAEEALRLVRQG
jgi:tRNA A37 threonylcarbamoyladenosine dehydratase